MFLIRPVREEDKEALFELIRRSGTGLTSLPKERALFDRKLEKSIQAFREERFAPDNEIYLFALECMESKKIGGLCGIYSKTGVESPVYHYRLKEECPGRGEIAHGISRIPHSLLTLHKTVKGPTENCALYLDPSYRRDGLGKLLSLSRLLFIASNRRRFDDIIIANLRAVLGKSGKPLFWEEVGRKFVDIEYEELLELLNRDPAIVPALLPKQPLYLSLLPKEVQGVVGVPHPNSAPAMQMLINEGFTICNKLDPFDAGPAVEAFIDKVHFIAEAEVATFASIEAEDRDNSRVIVCNNKLNFRAAYAHLHEIGEGEVALPAKIAKMLEVEVGERVRFSSLMRGKRDG